MSKGVYKKFFLFSVDDLFVIFTKYKLITLVERIESKFVRLIFKICKIGNKKI